mmetsp:Transcript_25712/g.60503  ORF Transcript_25712/g.60503 Transcript_25712/m.60503 type:complete len:1109 (-) Transcript_25712:67-3393(-)
MDPPPPYCRLRRLRRRRGTTAPKPSSSSPNQPFSSVDSSAGASGSSEQVTLVAQGLARLCRQIVTHSTSSSSNNNNRPPSGSTKHGPRMDAAVIDTVAQSQLRREIQRRLPGGDLPTLWATLPELRETLGFPLEQENRSEDAVVQVRPSSTNFHDLQDGSLNNMMASVEMSGALQQQQQHRQAAVLPSRIQYILSLLLQAICATIRPRPLVWVVEDLQWANEVAADLIWSLINYHHHNHHHDEDAYTEKSIQTAESGLLFIVTIQDEPNDDTDHLNEQSVELTTLELKPFSEEQCQTILSNLLNSNEPMEQHQESKIHGLASWVHRRTKGNIQAIYELLHMLQGENWLYYKKETQKWTWESVGDMEVEFDVHIGGNSIATSGVKLFHNRIRKLLTTKIDSKLLEMLKIACCLGYRVDPKALSYLVISKPESQHSVHGEVTEWLRVAESQGFLCYNHGASRFEFASADVQTVLYNMIGDHGQFHYHLGRTLWKACPVASLSSTSNNMLDIVVSQLLLGKSSIQDSREKSAVANLCLQAGARAAQQSSFHIAFHYLKEGINLLLSPGTNRQWGTFQTTQQGTPNNVDDSDYTLLLVLHNFCAEAAYCCADFDFAFELVQRVRENARSFKDTWAIESTNVLALGSSGKMNLAIDCGLQILRKLGATIPMAPTNRDIVRAHKSSKKLLKGRSDERLLRLPPIADAVASSKMHLLNLLFMYTMMVRPDLLPFIGWQMIEITVHSGLSGMASVGFALHAALLCGIGKDIPNGFRFGNLALKVCERFGVHVWSGRVLPLIYGCVHGWSRPIPESFEALRLAQRMSTESGDIEFAMLNYNVYYWNRIEYTNIRRLANDLEATMKRMEFYGQYGSFIMTKTALQYLHHLLGYEYASDLAKLLGQNENFELIALWAYSHEMVSSYLFGDYENSVRAGELCEELLHAPVCTVDAPVNALFIGLSAMAQAAQSKTKVRKFKLIARAKIMIRLVSKWSDHCPINFLGKLDLLEAELSVFQGKAASICAKKYTSAIALSREAGLVMQTALASERAGRYYLSIKDKENTTQMLKQAKLLYQEWGATLKVTHLDNEFGHLLQTAPPSERNSNEIKMLRKSSSYD